MNPGRTCLTDYYGDPKLAFYFWRDAQKIDRITLRYDKLAWKSGERFEGQVYLFGEGVESYSVSAYGSGYSLISTKDNEKYRLSTEFKSNRIILSVPDGDAFYVVCEWIKDGKKDSSVYMFLIWDADNRLSRRPVLKFSEEYRRLTAEN